MQPSCSSLPRRRRASCICTKLWPPSPSRIRTKPPPVQLGEGGFKFGGTQGSFSLLRSVNPENNKVASLYHPPSISYFSYQKTVYSLMYVHFFRFSELRNVTPFLTRRQHKFTEGVISLHNVLKRCHFTINVRHVNSRHGPNS